MTALMRAAALAVTALLVLVGCGDGDAVDDGPSGTEAPTSAMTSEPADPTDPPAGGEAAAGTFTVNGDEYGIGEVLRCETEGLDLDLIIFDDSDDLNITFLVEINPAGDWNARINGRTVKERYGDDSEFNAETLFIGVSGDYELDGNSLTGEFRLAQAEHLDPATVAFDVSIPAESQADCPPH